MSAHSVLRAVAACAPGKRITVFVPSGTMYALPIVPEPAPEAPPHPIEVLSQQLLERDVEARAVFTGIISRSDEAFATVRLALDTIASGQVEVAESVKELTGTLHLPVKPIYDIKGKLIAAQRVPVNKEP